MTHHPTLVAGRGEVNMNPCYPVEDFEPVFKVRRIYGHEGYSSDVLTGWPACLHPGVADLVLAEARHVYKV
jgi:hypothetical protein